jgi:adenine-specific DNA-methyltransferase
VIKYLGSKRRLVPALGAIAEALEVRTAADLFTGTTRVAQEFKRRRAEVWAIDLATYAHAFARCYIETDADSVDRLALAAALGELSSLPGVRGYVTEVFCEQARFFQPKNGMRIDAVRDALRDRYAASPLYPLLLTSLIEAADRVDSTTGLQMAYLKQWAPRAGSDLQLRMPELLPGIGHAWHGDAVSLAAELPEVDLAYLDPPYNQHRYFTNYHCWETLVRWDAPEHYGVACKRVDARDDGVMRSAFNSRRTIAAALGELLANLRARVVVLSYNDESFLSLDDLSALLADREEVQVVAFDSKRYVGAQIGIHAPDGRRVGAVSHVRNLEYLVIAGDRPSVARAVAAAGGAVVGGAAAVGRVVTPAGVSGSSGH